MLCDNGFADLAHKVLLQEECPSWLYEINNGATTIWESWAGIQPGGKVMNFSFNHYAFGCVGDFMVRKIAGLQVKEPGYKEFYIRPGLQFGVNEFALEYLSPQGLIKLSVKNNTLHIHVPAGSCAYVTFADLIEQPLASGEYAFPLPANNTSVLHS
ncbi:Bacterial alpha-L-rhamnosidase [compost metagenome]